MFEITISICRQRVQKKRNDSHLMQPPLFMYSKPLFKLSSSVVWVMYSSILNCTRYGKISKLLEYLLSLTHLTLHVLLDEARQL